MIRSLAAVLGEYDAYNELDPPKRGHLIAQKKYDEDHFGWTDEVIDSDSA
jgi:hypothetical protein